MGLTDKGVDRALADETAALLSAYKLGPYMNDAVENCDATELEAGQCVAVDGTTVITLEGGASRTDDPVSTIALDPSIRPPSNFDARSDPFEVNGGGGLRMNPAGDLLAAYWMGRFLDLNPVGQAGKSPFVRTHIPVPGHEPVADPTPETAEEVQSDVIEPADTTAPDAREDVAGLDQGSADQGNPVNDVVTETDDGTVDKGGSGCSAANGAAPAGPLFILILLPLALASIRRIRASR
jgi:hypothetical protein